MMETFTCDHCGAKFPIEAQTILAKRVLCETCLDELTADCGRLIHGDDTYYVDYDSDIHYCDDCIDQHRRGVQSYY